MLRLLPDSVLFDSNVRQHSRGGGGATGAVAGCEQKWQEVGEILEGLRGDGHVLA